MSFKRGPAYRVFISLENYQAGIVGTGTTLSVVTATDSHSLYGPNGGATYLGIGALGSVTATSDVAHEIKNLTGIDPAPASIDAPFDVFGQTRPMDNPVRKDWKVTLTHKAEDKLFLKLFAQCRFGVTGSASPALFDGLSTYPNEMGYRLYVYDGTDWDLYYHGTIDPTSYKLTLSPTGVTEEQVMFTGGLWKPAVATASADLTSSQSIVQA